MTDETGAQPPLDPAFEKIRRKMVRLLALSIAVLFVGLIAVLSAVVYRSAGPAVSTIADGGAPITLPAGARVLETSLGEGAILLRVAIGDSEEILLVDRPSGRIVSRYPLVFSQNEKIPSAP
ncbi:hypothetical protein [Aureimonas sp. AU20]|uniref:hypothetical protein n=1 Tax=Aureimonas sp. AU20 TaxID=1349819 RepID=UPI000720621B|nr:hypothetical protein [Aureimonas sp. AU20]ALN74018.1 hypothetical protein M673_14930 [Aureimonas sp. AU20]